jgi:DNA-binding LacI/PurR family transcriptional regulator
VSARGFTLLLAFIKGQSPRAEIDIIHKLVGRHVDGIILLSPFGNEESFKAIRETDVPIVFFGCYHEMGGINRVALDEYEAGCQAAAYLIGLGHTKVFCVTGPAGHFISRNRLQGFRDTLEHGGIGLPETNIYNGDFEFAAGKAAALHLVGKRLDVTAAWFQNDLMALGALGELQRLGVQVPGDLSIIGMDNIAQTEFCFPRLTTINQPVCEMASKAVEMLLGLPKGRDEVGREIVFAPQLVVRDSARRTS